MRRGVFLVLTLTSLLCAVGLNPAEAGAVTARSLLSRLHVSQEQGAAAFGRSAFGPATADADGDGCRTTAEVLLSESRTRPTRAPGCRVLRGTWVSSYDGRSRSVAADLVVDALVPYREAWVSGARSWSAATRNSYANDLGYRWSLGAVTPSSVRARRSRDPARWLPGVDRCAYALHWVAVKYRWSLTVDPRERAGLRAVLAGPCGRRKVALPSRRSVDVLDKPVSTPTPSQAAPTVPTVPTAVIAPPAPANALPTPTEAVSSPTPAPQAPVAVSGSVRTASGSPLVSAVVTAEDPASGAVHALASTSNAGEFSLTVAPGTVRLVIDSGSVDRTAAGLPGAFRWQGDLAVSQAVSLPVTLPSVRALTVVATDASGVPLAGASVTAPDPRPMTAAALWTGGPAMTGTQRVATQPAVTGADGRRVLRAFPSPDVGSMYVDHAPSPGTDQRAVLTSLAVDADTMVVAIPSRPGCTPRTTLDLGTRPTTLVADLDSVQPRVSASRTALLATADEIVAGTIPAVAYNEARTGDPLRYLYDEGVALRRVTGVLGYAYAATHDTRYLRTMANTVALNAASWPDWNPGHALDTAQVATAVALAYRWSAGEMTAGQRATVVAALTSRMVLEYSCADGVLAYNRSTIGNRNTVIATAATLAGLAVRGDSSAWASVGVADGTSALARFRLPDGTGRSLADGPTDEGLMYTTYEAANLALLHATRWRNPTDLPLAAALESSLADLGELAIWSERCGTVVDPGMEDAWDLYPWVDRPTALAAMAAWPGAGGHVLDLVAGLQARDTLTIPDQGSWQVADGIAELVLSGLTPGTSQPPTVQSHAPGGGTGAFLGCATNGGLRALVSAAPNDAAHAHRDVGNLVVSDGDQSVLADLGQRDYNFVAKYVWRGLTKAHNVVGVLQGDGRVTQTGAGYGSVTATPDGLTMVASNAMADIAWTRSVSLGPAAVTVRDQLHATGPLASPKQLSTSFLLAAPMSRVTNLGSGRVRFLLDDGHTWELQAPDGVTVSVTDARPSPPYDDTADFKATLGLDHSLVQLTAPLVTDLELVTTLTRVSG